MARQVLPVGRVKVAVVVVVPRNARRVATSLALRVAVAEAEVVVVRRRALRQLVAAL